MPRLSDFEALEVDGFGCHARRKSLRYLLDVGIFRSLRVFLSVSGYREDWQRRKADKTRLSIFPIYSDNALASQPFNRWANTASLLAGDLFLIWQTTRFSIALERPLVMGIVNVTPDSFSEDGSGGDVGAALAHCEALLAQGADILDLGGESSRPGAQPVLEAQEWARVAPVLEEVLRWGCPVSLDTVKPGVMRRALDQGVDIINDIHALRSPGAVEVIAESRCGVCLMHMQGQPKDMQVAPGYGEVVADVSDFLKSRVGVLLAAGVEAERVVLDPGIGFGKTVAHNFELLSQQDKLQSLGFPLLVGWSRKSSLGVVTGRPVAERLPASLAAALAAVLKGAKVLRVHDVAATVDGLKVWQAAGLVT